MILSLTHSDVQPSLRLNYQLKCSSSNYSCIMRRCHVSRAHSPSLTDAKCVGLSYFLIFIIVTEKPTCSFLLRSEMLEIDRELDFLVSLSSTLKFMIDVSMCIVLCILLTCETRPRHIPYTNTEENTWLVLSFFIQSWIWHIYIYTYDVPDFYCI